LGGQKEWRIARPSIRGFEVFVTVDRNLYFQQDIPKLNIAVVVLSARTNRLVDLKPLAPSLIAELPKLKPGEITVISR
jgi:hypothetical protein